MRKIRGFYVFLWFVFIVISLYAFSFFSGSKHIPSNLGPFHLYALMITMGAVFAYIAALLLGPTKGIDEDLIDRFALVSIPLGLVGARLGFVLQNAEYFQNHPLEVIGITPNGFGLSGLSIHGTIVAGVLALILFYGWVGLKTLDLGDLGASILLIGQAFGRFGNFFNQELYGYPTSLPWKMFIDPAHRLPNYYEQAFYHPTFFYEGVLCLIGATILAYRFLHKRKFKGQLIFEYLIIYSAIRFVVEFFRIEPPSLWGLHTAQILSLVLIVVCSILYALTLKFGRKLYVVEDRQIP
ncbi:prolipoprotein diacylglyceryl transferase [Coprothermobacter platensis]|jgi:phosphatidylglycerol:prolipoprotein diacylglycerol transferase|uniref:prolipoprotein diacylglyceryl transferase n=1 Tax=Coprothermobacter platensis TaxID=108819 RepID=UPI000371CBAE|nr:prolipoprotein diacylglyceryl transferase [Coprothermobacter platensis]